MINESQFFIQISLAYLRNQEDHLKAPMILVIYETKFTF